MRSHLGLLGANGKEVGQNWWTQGLHLGGWWLYMNLKYIARSFPNHSYVWGEDRWLWNNQVNWVPCQHVGGGFVFNLLAKCWPVVSHILQIFLPFFHLHSKWLNTSELRMVKELDTQRNSYKATYDELLAFQEENCSEANPTVSCPRHVAV